MLSIIFPLACIFPVGITSRFTPLLLTSLLLWYHGNSEIKNKDRSFSFSLSHIWSTFYFGIQMHLMKYCIAFPFSVQPITLLLSKTWSNGSIIHWPLSQNSLLWIVLMLCDWSFTIWHLISNSDMGLNNATFGITNSYHKNTNYYIFKYTWLLFQRKWAYWDKNYLLWEPVIHSSTESTLYISKDLYNTPIRQTIWPYV